MKRVHTLIIIMGIMLLPVIARAADDGVPRIAKEELKAKMDKGEDILVLDVRTGMSYTGSKTKIKGSMRMAPNDIEVWSKNLPKNKEIITYCTWPDEATSARVALKLLNKGFKDVKALKGGFDAWVLSGYPVESK